MDGGESRVLFESKEDAGGGGDQIERIDYVLSYIESIESNDEVYLLLLSLAC